LVDAIFETAVHSWRCSPEISEILQWPSAPSVVDPRSVPANQFDSINFTDLVTRRMRTFFKLVDDVEKLGIFDVWARTGDVALVHDRLAGALMRYEDFEWKFGTKLRGCAFRYELRLRNFGGCFKAVNGPGMKTAVSRVDDGGDGELQHINTTDESSRRLWLREMLGEICHPKKEGGVGVKPFDVIRNFEFRKDDEVFFEDTCQYLEGWARARPAKNSDLYSLLQALYARRAYYPRGNHVVTYFRVCNPFVVPLKLVTSGLVNTLFRPFLARSVASFSQFCTKY
jgi:hypothetical protein